MSVSTQPENLQEPLTADDVRAVARWSYQALAPHDEADWSPSAGSLTWDCRQTLEHLIQAFDRYSLYLACPSSEGAPRVSGLYDGLSNRDLLTFMGRRADVLAAVVAAAPATARGFHPSGLSDPAGFVAMACVETIVHTVDIGQGLGLRIAPPEEICRRALTRLFPWAPTDVDLWSALRWATGRDELPHHPLTPPNWAWHSAPLAEWDGTIRVRP